MKWIGLTGGIATGKSTVSKILRDLGLPVVDADSLAREVTQIGSSGLKLVVSEFGEEVLMPDGSLNRKRLGEIIFSDSNKRLKLEAILHPLIQKQRALAKLELERRGFELAFYDVPLLFEKNMQDEFDATVLVYCKPEEQKARLRERDGLSVADSEKRIHAQMPIDEKIKLADFIIMNTASVLELKANVLAVVQELNQNN